MNQALIIVESPTKARTIKKFLPQGYEVIASMGHIRDLPSSAREIPKSHKEEAWARLGVDVAHDFAPLYVVPYGQGKHIKELKAALKGKNFVYLATDEDREGESISWHLLQVLNPKVPVKRMVFHEITKEAILRAIEEGRDLDIDLVHAQETRRILDRLYGYTLSPLLWRKLIRGLSAGRVQSPGLRLLVDREKARMAHVSALYLDALATYKTKTTGESFEARLQSIDGKSLALAKDFDPNTGELAPKSNAVLLGKDELGRIATELRDPQTRFVVAELNEKTQFSKPAAPFITSSLQQEANRKLGFSARKTMSVAQTLYEQGYITYMRTDSYNLSSEAIKGARAAVAKLFGDEALTPKARNYGSAKGAQEAHEAIRPAGSFPRGPESLKLDKDQFKLYSLIYKRTLATQMIDAEKLITNLKVVTKLASYGKELSFSASGSRIIEPGFMRLYVVSHDEEGAYDDMERLLPKLEEGQEVELQELDPQEHYTKAPSRYTEASLIKELEKLGIGRPSTYAAILSTLKARDYMVYQGKALAPTFTGFAVIQLLEEYFDYLVEYDFTSSLENALDEIAQGERDYIAYLHSFFSGSEGLEAQAQAREKAIEDARTLKFAHLAPYVLAVGAYGVYAQKGEEKRTIPEDVIPSDLTIAQLDELFAHSRDGESLGKDPKTGKNVYVLSGRFGYYVQLGETPDAEDKEAAKPRRASIPKQVRKPSSLSLEDALRLLALPRVVGTHPETGEEIEANNGRFGPYVRYNGTFYSLPKGVDPVEVSFEEALDIIANSKKGASTRIDLGEVDGVKVEVLAGRYGTYAKYGKKNIRLSAELKERDPKSISLDEVKPFLDQEAKPKKTTRRKAKTAKS